MAAAAASSAASSPARPPRRGGPCTPRRTTRTWRTRCARRSCRTM
uniref:Uncharacterized protein n=1 Tax=Zea mays TaxID=4577 RepID=B4FTV1_MAIZE|nr:unknown [Zea mays]